MDLHKINGPQDYSKFYHTSSEGLVWLDGKGNPIPLSHTLSAHVEAIDSTELWNSIQTRSKVHRQNIPVLGHGPTNSTAIDPNTPLMTTPTSPIMDHPVEVNKPEGSNIAMAKDLLEDPHIQPRMMQSALGTVTSPFTQNKSTQLTESNDPIVPHKVPVRSAPNDTDTHDFNKELNTYKDRLTLELNNFKKKINCKHRVRLRWNV